MHFKLNKWNQEDYITTWGIDSPKENNTKELKNDKQIG